MPLVLSSASGTEAPPVPLTPRPAPPRRPHHRLLCRFAKLVRELSVIDSHSYSSSHASTYLSRISHRNPLSSPTRKVAVGLMVQVLQSGTFFAPLLVRSCNRIYIELKSLDIKYSSRRRRRWWNLDGGGVPLLRSQLLHPHTHHSAAGALRRPHVRPHPWFNVAQPRRPRGPRQVWNSQGSQACRYSLFLSTMNHYVLLNQVSSLL